MASAKKDEKADTQQPPAAFDWASFLKTGGVDYTVDDMRDVGGLTPIYPGEMAGERNWPPLVGFLIGIQWLEFKKETDPKQRHRPFFIVEAEIPTMGLEGTGDDRDEVQIKKGDYILMPISGALKNIKELRAAAADPKLVHRVAFRVTGVMVDVGRARGQEMREIEAKLIAKPIERTGRHALLETETLAPALQAAANGVTRSGEVYDKDGVVRERVVGAQQ